MLNKRLMIFFVVVMICLIVPFQVHADNITELSQGTNEQVYTPDDWFYVENGRDEQYTNHLDIIEPLAIGQGSVKAVRKPSTKVQYSYTVSFNPIPDTIKVKVWKCVYSSGKWKTQGAAKESTYSSTSSLKKSGGFNVKADKSYKIKVYIIEKRGSKTSSKVFYSGVI